MQITNKTNEMSPKFKNLLKSSRQTILLLGFDGLLMVPVELTAMMRNSYVSPVLRSVINASQSGINL